MRVLNVDYISLNEFAPAKKQFYDKWYLSFLRPETASAITLEAALLVSIITLTYFVLLIPVEHSIVEGQIEEATRDTVRAFSPEILALDKSDKEALQIQLLLYNMEPDISVVDQQLALEENNRILTNNSIITVACYCTFLVTVSLVLYFKSKGTSAKFSFMENLAEVSIAAILILIVEILFVVFIIGRFLIVDPNIAVQTSIDTLINLVYKDLPLPPSSSSPPSSQ